MELIPVKDYENHRGTFPSLIAIIIENRMIELILDRDHKNDEGAFLSLIAI